MEAQAPLAADPKTDPTLTRLVEAFFRSSDPKKQASLRSAIEESAKGSLPLVAQAIARADLWPALADRHGSFPFESRAWGPIEIAYRLPLHYNPRQRYAMVICLGETHGTDRNPCDRLTTLAVDRLSSFVLIAPARPIGATFHQSIDASSDWPRFLRAVGKRIHVDRDRIFLFGADRGGDAAWLAAIAHADWFAGVLVLSSYPHVPYPEQVYPFLLRNLSRLPVLTVWRRAVGADVTMRLRAVATHNQLIAALAGKQSLPITFMELDRSGPKGLVVPPARIVSMLARKRDASSHAVTHWFRYPAQGHADWLVQARFKGDVWAAPELSILPSPSTDRAPFIAKVVQERLAYLGGRVEGQTITIETRHCARVDLLLPEGLVDLNQPITVRCNGKKRHEGLIPRRIATLLDTAYHRWEFQRLSVAKLSFSIKTDATDLHTLSDD